MSTNEINDISENAQTNSLEESTMYDTWNLLKFTPVTYRIEIEGLGAVLAVGKITEEAYEYWCDYSSSDLTFFAEHKGFDVPSFADIFQENAWHDLCEVIYLYEAIICECNVVVYDEKDKVHFKSSLDVNGLAKSSINAFMVQNLDDRLLVGQPYYMGKMYEHGLYFTGELRLKEPFDASKLSLSYAEYEDEKFLSQVFYDNNIVDDVGENDTDTDVFGSNECEVFKLVIHTV